MRVSRTLTITFCLIVGMFVLMPSFSVSAADPQFINPLNIESPDPSNPRQVAAVSVELHARILKLVVQFLSVILFLMMLWGGWQYLTAAGDPEKVESGQRTMVWAVLGAIIIFSSYAITVWVIEKFAAPFGISTAPQSQSNQQGDTVSSGDRACCIFAQKDASRDANCGTTIDLDARIPDTAAGYDVIMNLCQKIVPGSEYSWYGIQRNECSIPLCADTTPAERNGCCVFVSIAGGECGINTSFLNPVSSVITRGSISSNALARCQAIGPKKFYGVSRIEPGACAYDPCFQRKDTANNSDTPGSTTACCVFPAPPGSSGNYRYNVQVPAGQDITTYCNTTFHENLFGITGYSTIGMSIEAKVGACTGGGASTGGTNGASGGSGTSGGVATGATGATGKGCCIPILAGTSKAYASCYEPIPDNNGRLFCNRGGVQDGRTCSTVSECNLGTPGDPYEPGCCYWNGTPERCAYVGSDTECRTRRSGDSFHKGERCNDTCALKESNDTRYP